MPILKSALESFLHKFFYAKFFLCFVMCSTLIFRRVRKRTERKFIKKDHLNRFTFSDCTSVTSLPEHAEKKQKQKFF